MKIFAEHKGRYGSTRIMEEMKDVHAFPIRRQTVSKRVRNWNESMAHFTVRFSDRLEGHL